MRWIVAIFTYILTDSFFDALIAFFICSWIESLIFSKKTKTSHFSGRQQITVDAFLHELLIFTAAVMKSDGRLMKSELHYVKNFLIQNLGSDKAHEALLDLREILEQEYNLMAACRSFRNHSDISERLLMLKFLFGVAAADEQISEEELKVIQFISNQCGIPQVHFESLKAMYTGRFYTYDSSSNTYNNRDYSSGNYHYSSTSQLDNDYKILGIDENASDEEVKKAFRNLAKEHHPDKVSHLGEEMRKAAEEKFARLNEAYDRIKKARGMK